MWEKILPIYHLSYPRKMFFTSVWNSFFWFILRPHQIIDFVGLFFAVKIILLTKEGIFLHYSSFYMIINRSTKSKALPNLCFSKHLSIFICDWNYCVDLYIIRLMKVLTSFFYSQFYVGSFSILSLLFVPLNNDIFRWLHGSCTLHSKENRKKRRHCGLVSTSLSPWWSTKAGGKVCNGRQFFYSNRLQCAKEIGFDHFRSRPSKI